MDGLTEEYVASPNEMMKVIQVWATLLYDHITLPNYSLVNQRGNVRRKVSSTQMNADSSRSHSLLLIHSEQIDRVCV